MTTPTLNLIIDDDDTLDALNNAGVSEQVERAASEVTGGPGTISPEPVVNVTQGKEYTRIQDAVDEAGEDDTIEVKSGTYESVSIGVDGLTLKGPNSGTAGDNNEGRGAEATVKGRVSINADSVTVDGFAVRNPGEQGTEDPSDYAGAVGVQVNSDSENVTVANNRVTEIGVDDDDANPHGVLANDGTAGLTVSRNFISNLEGTDEDEAAAHAIQVDESGTTIDSVDITDNVITDVLDTRSTVAIKFNGDVSGSISGNAISDLNTEGETADGDPGGFTQVIALSAGGASDIGPSDVSVTNNEISDIETTTADNFAPAYHLIISSDSDASTIDIHSNEFSGDSTDDEEVYLGDGTGNLDLNDIADSNNFDPEGQVEENAIVRPFSENPFLLDAQTDKGGLFANVGDADNLVALEEGMKMSDFPTGEVDALETPFVQLVYANTTDESISVEVESIGFGPEELSLGVNAYNKTVFGTDDQWYRIPTGAGTPYPISFPETAWDADGNFEGAPMQGGPEGDYELVEISETENGFKVVWEYLGFAAESTTGEVEQPPEEDAEAYL